MLDIKFIRENPDLVAKGARDKNFKIDIPRLLELDSVCRGLQSETETLQTERNRLSKSIAHASPAERETLKAQVQDIKRRMDELTPKLESAKSEFDTMMLVIPAPARADVPVGKDDTENVEVKKWGTIPKFDFNPLDHAVVGEKLGIIDFGRGVKLAGSRSYILRGDGARLEQAILRYTFDKLCQRGYTPMTVPVLVKEEAMTGTGYFPTGREQAYYIEKDERALVGTAEVSLTSYHSDEILQESELPFRSMAWSSCFRREAGTYGKDTKGLYRVHQFQKIEQVIIAPADAAESEKLHAELLKNAEDILQDFGLAYRVVYVCTGDLGQGQVRKHDIETWMPSRGAYSETHSCSTFHDFQARRLKLRYRTKSGEVKTCYTLNNTAIATPRVMIPLLECYQQADGSVKIPDALVPYMNGQKIIKAPG
jgi:seryl-tRNA synthetase